MRGNKKATTRDETRHPPDSSVSASPHRLFSATKESKMPGDSSVRLFWLKSLKGNNIWK